MATPEAQREYQRKWMARRRADWFATAGPCIDCGSDERLELDHVDPASKVHHAIWSWSASRREVELAKCVVRCESCHSVKSATECVRGEENGRAKLTDRQVLEMRERYAAGGVSLRKLAQEYGLTHNPVHKIIRGQTWTHLL